MILSYLLTELKKIKISNIFTKYLNEAKLNLDEARIKQLLASSF